VDAGASDDAGGAGSMNGPRMDAGVDAARPGDPAKKDGETANGGKGSDDDAGVDEAVDHDAGADAAEPPQTKDAGRDATTTTGVDAGPCGGEGYTVCWRDEDGDRVAPLGAAQMMVCGKCDDGWVGAEPTNAANDCAPQDDTVHAGATELCNDADDDCDGSVDEGASSSCSFDNGSGACVGGSCQLMDCNPGFDDCDGTEDNGCEQPLDSVDHCGACDMVCSYANGTGACVEDACVLTACDVGFDDCDGYDETGCEQPLDIDGHCGACNVTCTYSNAFGACVDSQCELDTCYDGYADCDGYEETGCEQSLDVAEHCGGCGVTCHALAACDTSWVVPQCVCQPPSFALAGACHGPGPLATGMVPWVCGIDSDRSAECWYVQTDYGESSGEFVQLAAGRAHVCGLTADGDVECWGDNEFGQAQDQDGPFIQVVAGYVHTCGLGADAKVTCWGTPDPAEDFGQAEPLDDDFKQLTAGAYHTCGLHPDGTVECWGAGKMITAADCQSTEQCGQSLAPNILAGRFVQLAAGRWHTCGLREDSSAYCWGAGSNSDAGQADPPEGVSFHFIASGQAHTCGVTDSGTLACWGLINTLEEPPSGSNWERVYGAWNHACALDSSGSTECWGRLFVGASPAEIDGTWPLIP
jgi:hypothetical protein